MNGIIRLAVLLGWAVLVFAAGGIAVKLGAGQVITGGIEVVALILGVVAAMATPMWSRSIRRDRDSARV